MIRIFNKILHYEIIIDESIDIVQLTPRQYEIENPHVLIELHKINFLNHSKTCNDCGAFIKALGTNSHDWFIDINGKVNRLDLKTIGKKYLDNHIKRVNSSEFHGTRLKLNLDFDTIESLQLALQEHEQSEDYERCCILRDKISAIGTS